MKYKYLTKKAVIYKLVSPSNKVYIGQSINFPCRVNKYINTNCGGIGNKIKNAINKYGFENFILEFLYIGDIDTDVKITKEILNKLEIHYIDIFNSIENGYNLTGGGMGSYKRVVTEETRLKLSQANKGKSSKKTTIVIHACSYCNANFEVSYPDLKRRLKNSKIGNIYCTKNCQHKSLKKI